MTTTWKDATMGTTTLDYREAQALEAVAAAYRNCRAALEGLRQPWADLRDPANPWHQNMLLLHDRHQDLLRAAGEVENSLYTACELYAAQQELGYHQRDRSLIEHLEHHPDLKDGLFAVGLHPGSAHPVSLEEYAPRHIVENYPAYNRVAYHAQALVEAQRAYIRTALNPR